MFLPNYCVSQSEKVIPAADLSQQISTAGMEASGTGNMKLAMNGALTIGTLDGANIEILEQVGKENFFMFGLTQEEVLRKRAEGYRPQKRVRGGSRIAAGDRHDRLGLFLPGRPALFRPVVDSLLRDGEPFMVLADYRSYMECQEQVSRAYLDQEDWTRRSILNTARMGYFSSDRTVLEYASEIWDVKPLA